MAVNGGHSEAAADRNVRAPPAFTDALLLQSTSPLRKCLNYAIRHLYKPERSMDSAMPRLFLDLSSRKRKTITDRII